jgi:mannonate dehydratase
MIRNCAEAGIPSVKYNMTLIGVVRTESTRGRGGTTYSTFVYAKAKHDAPLTEAGPVPEDVYWERITYVLENGSCGRVGNFRRGAPYSATR